MKKIVIFQLRPGIGDMCIFLPAIKEIGKKYSKSRIILIAKKSSKLKVFINKNDYNLRKIIYIEDLKKNSSTFLSLLNYLLLNKFDTSFIMHYGFKYFIPCKISKIRNIFHYGFFKKKENISKKIKQSIKAWLSINSFNMSTLIGYDGPVVKKRKILIGIGSSGKSRRWTTKNFTKLIKDIDYIGKYNFYILAGVQETEQANDIIRMCNNINIKSLCNKNIYETFKYIKCSKLYVGTDSAFMHLSAALNVKSFGLFGDTPTNYSDYSNQIIPIIPEGYDFISHNSNAMKKIRPKWVLKNIKKYLV